MLKYWLGPNGFGPYVKTVLQKNADSTGEPVAGNLDSQEGTCDEPTDTKECSR